LLITCLVWAIGGEPAVPFGAQAAGGDVAALAVDGSLPDDVAVAERQLVATGDAELAATGGSNPVIEFEGAKLDVIIRRADGEAVANVPVFVDYVGGNLSGAGGALAVTNDAGTASFVRLQPGKVEITIGRSEYAYGGGDGERLNVAAGELTTHTITMSGVTVRGVVVDDADRPVGGARIVLHALTDREVATTDLAGRFVVEGVLGGVRFAARKRGFAPSPLHAMPAVVDSRIGDLRIVLPAAGGSLSCLVRGPLGDPCEQAVVSVGPGHWVTRQRAGDAAQWSALTDAEGRVVFEGLAYGTVDVLVRRR